MGISHAFQLTIVSCSIWIMGRPTAICTAIKVIVEAASGEIRSVVVGERPEQLWHHISTQVNLFKQFTSDWPLLKFHQAASAFFACDPVVDVALDEEFCTNGVPQRKVRGLKICLIQRNCGRHWSLRATGCPAWTRRDSVWAVHET